MSALVDDGGAIRPRNGRREEERVRKEGTPGAAEQEHAAHRRNLPILVEHSHLEGPEVGGLEPADRGKAGAGGFEVDRLHADLRHRLLVEGPAPDEALELVDLRRVGTAIGGADPHVDACGRGPATSGSEAASSLGRHGWQ